MTSTAGIDWYKTSEEDQNGSKIIGEQIKINRELERHLKEGTRKMALTTALKINMKRRKGNEQNPKTKIKGENILINQKIIQKN